MLKTRDYKAVISEYIRKNKVILGPVVAVEKARKSGMVKLKGDGTVVQIIGEGEEVLTKIESEYETLIGNIAHTVLLKVINKNSGIEGAESHV